MRKDTLRDKELNIKDTCFEKLMIIYSIALVKVEILLIDYILNINHIEYNMISRIKKPKSIIDKIFKKGYNLKYQALIENINDIAGVRIICMTEEDIYKIVEKIEDIKDIKILNKKDYIKNPKKSGYSAYHIIVEVPIYLQNKKIWVKVEIQIRTLSMDYWANIEHGVSYKAKA